MKFLRLAIFLLAGIPLLAQTGGAPGSQPAPRTAKEFSDRAQSREDHGDLPGAIADFTEAIRLNPNDAVARDARGYAESRTGDLEAAMADYDRALQLDAKDWDAYNDRANAELAQQKWDAALSDYNEAIRLNPRFAHAYNGRGNWSVDRGDLDQARTDFTEALTLEPKYAHAFNGRGLAELEQTDFDNAIGDFSQAIALSPDYAHAYFNRGMANFARKHLAEALPDLDRAAQLDPTDGETHFLDYLCRNGDPAQMATAAAGMRHDLMGPSTDPWTRQLGKFVLGDISQDELLKGPFDEAPDRRKEQLCQAFFYIGAKAELAGNAADADKYYRQAEATGVANFTDYILASVKIDTEPSAVPEPIMPPAIWINGTVKKQGDVFLFTADRPVTGDTMNDVVLLGTRPADKDVMGTVYDHAAEKHLKVRFYGCLMTFSGSVKGASGPVPNIEFIVWKMHLPGQPDAMPEKDRLYLHSGAAY